jgi:hypothetical protein
MKNILISTAVFFLLLAGAGCEYHKYQTIQPSEPQQTVSEGTPEAQATEPTTDEVVLPENESGSTVTPPPSEATPEPEAAPEENPAPDTGEGVEESADEGSASGEKAPSDSSSKKTTGKTESSGRTGPAPGTLGTGATPAAPPCRDDQARNQEGTCVCDAARHFYPPRNGSDQCVKKVQGLQVMIQTGSRPGMGTDLSDGQRVLFDLCSDQDFRSKDCFRASISGEFDLGQHKILDFGLNPELNASSNKPLSTLEYPTDFQYFRFASDPDHPIDDPWFLAGVAVYVKLEGDSVSIPVYVNGCVNRWIDENRFSPHSLEDDAWCVYLETGSSHGLDDATNANTNPIKFLVRLNESLVGVTATNSWITSYAGQSPTGPEITGFSSEYLHIRLRYAHYDDFCSGCDTSYGATFFDGRGRVGKAFKLSNEWNNAWFLHKVKAYYFRPGDPDFLNGNQCWIANQTPNAWLSSDTSDRGGHASFSWPENDDQDLTEQTCDELSSIRFRAGVDAFGVF